MFVSRLRGRIEAIIASEQIAYLAGGRFAVQANCTNFGNHVLGRFANQADSRTLSSKTRGTIGVHPGARNQCQ